MEGVKFWRNGLEEVGGTQPNGIVVIRMVFCIFTVELRMLAALCFCASVRRNNSKFLRAFPL